MADAELTGDYALNDLFDNAGRTSIDRAAMMGLQAHATGAALPIGVANDQTLIDAWRLGRCQAEDVAKTARSPSQCAVLVRCLARCQVLNLSTGLLGAMDAGAWAAGLCSTPLFNYRIDNSEPVGP